MLSPVVSVEDQAAVLFRVVRAGKLFCIVGLSYTDS